MRLKIDKTPKNRKKTIAYLAKKEIRKKHPMEQHSPNRKLEVKELKITYDPIETKWIKMKPKLLRKKVTQIQEYTKSDPQKKTEH
ncbi:MAG: hypothetical protein D3922_17125, partial [Candidatus Electrothrix sp. AR1]|nr:hypothetical protein [Candidatus Electrothrix sp. AR1]